MGTTWDPSKGLPRGITPPPPKRRAKPRFHLRDAYSKRMKGRDTGEPTVEEGLALYEDLRRPAA